VTTISIRSGDSSSSHQRISRFTHFDAAASGESSRMNHADRSICRSIEVRRSDSGARLDMSRKTRSARARFHGFAKRSRERCRRAANATSARL
jgi:hypothetical protein